MTLRIRVPSGVMFPVAKLNQQARKATPGHAAWPRHADKGASKSLAKTAPKTTHKSPPKVSKERQRARVKLAPLPIPPPRPSPLSLQSPPPLTLLRAQGATGIARLVLKAGKEKSLHRRHPWIYASAVARLEGSVASGDTLAVHAADGTFLAWAAYSPNSSIQARAWSYAEDQPPDAQMISDRIEQALKRRATLTQRTNAIRLVFGEADQLPGLVVDRYADQLVVQFFSSGVEFWRDTIVAALQKSTDCRLVYERSDAAAREREGLPSREGALVGAAPEMPIRIVEDGVHYAVDVITGHKTGFYIDQRDSRARVAALALGRRVLNCFCYTGGFTLAALANGAVSALSIDSSEPALQQARANQHLNGIADQHCEWRNANVFEALKSLAVEGRQFDLIVLDPPKFAPSAHHLDRAARAYKEINMKALKLLAPGGVLLTFSCSGAVSVDLFQKIVAGAVIDAEVDAQLIERLGAGVDHPMLMTHPEGEYLKGLLLARV
jgi:23S rRNA (cytosine1962-C5)-methyltransferase